jgi:hypothetical protein
MAYKYSKGAQVIGDLKAADDAERNTQIDFEEDEIKFDTGGATRLIVENTIITTTVPIHISGSVTEGLRIAKAGSDYREIQFETNGVDTAFIQVDASEGMIIGCQSVNDEIIFQTTDTGGISEVMRVTANSRLGIGTTSPSHKLDVNGDIRIRGNDIRDNSGNPAITFDGSANTTIAGNLSTSGGFIAQLDVVSSSPFAVTSAHHYLAVDTSAARTINLPAVSTGDVGRVLTIFDAAGNANNQNITINVGDVSEDISGASNYTINSAGGVVTIICASEDGWIVINKIT